MATVTHAAFLATTSQAASYVSAAFTPAVDDQIVVFALITATAAAGSCTDSQGGTYTRITTSTKAGGSDKMYLFVRDALVPAASSTTCTVDIAGDGGTGCVMFVARVAGMTRTGASAARQSAVQNGQSAGTTPAPVFGSAALTDNPTLGAVFNGTSPATMTPPTSWTEDANGDKGYSTPTAGGEYVFRDSGFTGTTITWGSTSATAFCDISVELDTTAAPVAGGSTLALMGVG